MLFLLRIESQHTIPLCDLTDFTLNWPVRPKAALRADTLIKSTDHGTVVIEHAVNVSLDKHTTNSHSLRHHVYAQAEACHYALKPSSTWVLHWTTAKNGDPEKDEKTVKYWFPSSPTVNTIYVYHYDDFRKAEIWTSPSRFETVDIPWPPPINKRKHEAGSLSFPPFNLKSVFHSITLVSSQ